MYNIQDVVHEAICTSKLEREGNTRGSTRTPQHKLAATAKIEAEENGVQWAHTTQRRHHSNTFRRKMKGKRPGGKQRQIWFSNIVQ